MTALARTFGLLIVFYACMATATARLSYRFWRGVTRVCAYGAYRSGRRALDARLNLQDKEGNLD